ncbi:hypothetical protein TNCV_842371 [Trichonephila clavipes]|nr:hypothetical protein TNCV_842371 [Trichonephila clavipes]
MVRKKRKKNALLKPGRTQSLLPNDISVNSEEASQFAMNKRNTRKEKKEEKREFPPNPVKKDVAPSTRKKSSSPESLYNNTVNLITIKCNSERKTSNAKVERPTSKEK